MGRWEFQISEFQGGGAPVKMVRVHWAGSGLGFKPTKISPGLKPLEGRYTFYMESALGPNFELRILKEFEYFSVFTKKIACHVSLGFKCLHFGSASICFYIRVSC